MSCMYSITERRLGRARADQTLLACADLFDTQIACVVLQAGG